MKGSDRCHADDAFCTMAGQTLRVSNLGPGGLFACSMRPPTAGELVVLDVQLPRRTLHLEGVVCWVNPAEKPLTHSLPPGFGVRFNGLTAGDRLVLSEYIQRADTVLRDDRRGRSPAGRWAR
ncbi:MAG TPA: PilZ domain-containing protein [Vicinamibacteria bacterium]|nr:PilZ domain-containing protein [Vicinamibacteria bacterium]